MILTNVTLKQGQGHQTWYALPDPEQDYNHEKFERLPLNCVRQNHQHHHHLSLNHEGRWGTTDDFATPVLHRPLGVGKLQACPFPDVVFPPLPLSALSSSPPLWLAGLKAPTN